MACVVVWCLKNKKPEAFRPRAIKKVCVLSYLFLVSTHATGPKRICFGHHNGGGGFDVAHRLTCQLRKGGIGVKERLASAAHPEERVARKFLL